MTDISNSDDMIDIRDVIARVEELREERNALQSELDEYDASDAPDAGRGDRVQALESWNGEEGIELATLESLLSDLAGYGGDEQWEGDWYPISLIRDSYFTEAMQELCKDIGDMPNGIPSYMVIDWEATADNLRVDYSSVEFDGVTYWYR